MVGGWRLGQVESSVEYAAHVRGRRYGDWDATLADLRRRGDSNAYLSLLHECISATERESCAWAVVHGSLLVTPPKYTLAAAEAYRKAGRLDLEIAVLTRYLAMPGNARGGAAVTKRLTAARRLAARSAAPLVIAD